MRFFIYLLGIVVLSLPSYSMPWWMNRDNGNNNRHMSRTNHENGGYQGHINRNNRGKLNGFKGNRHSRRGSIGNNGMRGMGHGGMGGMNIGGAFVSSHFATHQLCARCHDNLKDSSGQDVSIPKDWRSTMMANSGVDPLWQAKVHSEILRNPSFKEVIEKKCATCHMPMAKTQAEFDGNQIKIFGKGGFLDKSSKYHKLAVDGVSCTLCHQIQPDSSFSGNYIIDKYTKKPYRKIFGPFKNPFQRPMQRMAKYTPVYSPHMKSSKLCATCHTLHTPSVYEGNVVGKFPEQTPYLEWENSIYAKNGITCQKCHMPEANGGVKISRMPRFLKERSPFAKHYFVGGNVFMLSILKKNASSLGSTASPSEFDRTIKRTLDMLKNKTANIHIGAVSLKNGILEFPVIVENKAGHKFPTGIPFRRAWLHVVVKDATGKTVFESGAVSKDGKIKGADSDEGTGYEQHYDVITSPEQVQIYEAIMKDFNGNVTYTLLNAYDYAKDNRLLPEGFSSSTSDIAAKGNASNDENFIGGSDTVLYRINVKNSKAPYKITVELRYQSVSYSFYKDLIKDADKSYYIKRFETFYKSEENTGIVIDKEEIKF